jgi:hypothetical protein
VVSPGFPWFSEMWSMYDHCVSLISFGVLCYIEHWNFISNLCGIPLVIAACLHLKLNIKYISSTSFLLTSWGLSYVIFPWHWLLEVVTWNTSNHMINLHFWSPSHFISWFNKNWHLEICDSSWLAWFLGLNIHFLFSITYGTSTSRLPLAFYRYMVHHS